MHLQTTAAPSRSWPFPSTTSALGHAEEPKKIGSASASGRVSGVSLMSGFTTCGARPEVASHSRARCSTLSAESHDARLDLEPLRWALEANATRDAGRASVIR